jgi:hypothetical protein
LILSDSFVIGQQHCFRSAAYAGLALAETKRTGLFDFPAFPRGALTQMHAHFKEDGQWKSEK